MPIWFRDFTLEEVNRRGKGTMVEHLGIRILEIGDEQLVGNMPVDERTKQPIGLLHGGASVALAETLASTAGNLVVDPANEYCVGLEINANHIGSCREGFVVGKSTPLHLGRTTQIWETRITQGERLVCISRMTLAVLKKKTG
ncbi:MAG: hotdog fold thioesterase [Oligoflexia bacterium]|nr:hotdog fold thioesterase [Oligoflexia bacterium]